MLTLPPRFPRELHLGLSALWLTIIDQEWLRSLLAWAIETFAKDEIFADLLRSARHKPIGEFYDLTAKRNALRRRFTTEVRHSIPSSIVVSLTSPLAGMGQAWLRRNHRAGASATNCTTWVCRFTHLSLAPLADHRGTNAAHVGTSRRSRTRRSSTTCSTSLWASSP